MIKASPSFWIANAKQAKSPFLTLEIDGYARVFSNKDTGIAGHWPWIAAVGSLAFTVSALDGTSSINDLVVTVVDLHGALTADMPSITLEGKTCRLRTGFIGMDYSDFVTLFTGEVDMVVSQDDNNCYDFTCKDTRRSLQQVVYLSGDNGLPTSSSSPKTVVGNPMDIAKSVMLDYCLIDAAFVDSAALDSYRDQMFAGLNFQFSITSPPDAKSFLESQIFKPLGGYLRASSSGKLTPQFAQPLAGSIVSIMDLNPSNLVKLPLFKAADLINVVSYRFDKDDSGNSSSSSNNGGFLSEAVRKSAPSIAKYKQQGQHIIESDGVRAGFQGFSLARIVAQSIFNRHGSKNPTCDVTLLWTACLLELGDFVTVTHPSVPDRKAGVMGLNKALFQVEGVTLDFDAYTATITLVDASGLSALGAFRVAADSQADWTAATSAQKARYMFMSDATGKYSDATAGNTLA